jgi:hypothetical protein
MSLEPHAGTGVVAFTNGARCAIAWLTPEVNAILGHILGVPAPAIPDDIPHHPELWTDVCGWYSFRGSLRDAQKWLVAGAEVLVRRGQLTLRPLTPVPALAGGLPLHPDDAEDPCVFRIDLSSLGLGTSRVVFSRSPHAVVTAFHLDLDTGPLSFDKQPAATNPRYWAGGALGAVAAAATANAAGDTGNTRRCEPADALWRRQPPRRPPAMTCHAREGRAERHERGRTSIRPRLAARVTLIQAPCRCAVRPPPPPVA